MSSTRTWSIGAAVLIVLLAGIAAWRMRAPEAPATVTTPAQPKQARTFKPGTRTTVPRKRTTRTAAAPEPPAPPDLPSAAPLPPASVGAGSDTPASDGPIDRREHPPADAERTRKAILERMDDVSDDISACLGDWMEEDPGLAGHVNVGFRIDADGLQEAFILDHTDVPFGPLSCFGSAIDAVDWAGVTSEPLEVTFPFEFSATPAPAP